MTQSYGPIHDPLNDSSGARNVVPDSGPLAAAYVYNDGVNAYFRIRLDADPTGSGGQGLLLPFSWGFEIDTDQNADDYEWLIIINGVASNEVIELRQNTMRTQLGDPSDKAEYIAAQYPVAGNYRILPAGSCYNGTFPDGTCDGSNTGLDYFLDFKLPLSVLKSATGITDNTLIRYFVGSTSAFNNLTESGADLVGGSTLYAGLSDYITLSGVLPPGATFYDGSVRFTTNIAGVGDRALAGLNETLYIRVDDLDLNASTNPSGTVRVLLESPTGDREILLLSATGVQGKYTGSIATSASTNTAGTLYVTSGQTVTVTFIEAVSANLVQNVVRTDTILFTSTATDLGIGKVLISNPIVTIGDTAVFAVTVTNHGPNNKASTIASDLLPAGLTFVSATFSPAQGSYNSGSGAWDLGALNSGSSVTMTLTATVAAGAAGIITNSATLPADSYPGNDSASAAIFVGGTDLQVTKAVSNTLPLTGNTVTFTVRVINLGPNSTNGVVVKDLLPAGLSFTSATPSQGSYNSGSGLWSVGTITSGNGAQLTINATVSAANGQSIINTASLNASSQPDIDPDNNSASTLLKVGYTDLSLNKIARKITAPVGPAGGAIAANISNTIEFTVTLSNKGPHTATNITVKDLLPVGMTFLSASPLSGNYNSSTGFWTIPSLAPGGSVTLTIQARINSGTSGQVLLNEARITAVDQADSAPGDEYAFASVAVNGTDLQVTKSVSNTTPAPGNTIVWEVKVTNNGPNPAASIVITDILPTGVTYVSHETLVGTYDAGKSNSNYQWSGFSLVSLATATLKITTTVNSGTGGKTITNDAFLTSASVTDADEMNNTGSATIAVSGTDLRITKSVTSTAPNTGDIVSYVLTASNAGTNPANGVIVNDLLPPELIYVSHSGGTYSAATGIWNVGNLIGGASSQLTILARVLNENNNLTIRNTATISAPGVGDPNPANNITTVDISVGATDLALSKTVNKATPAPGETIAYTLTVSNVSTNPASGIQVEEILPSGVTYLSHTASQGAYVLGLWLVGNLASSSNPGSSATLTIMATVDAPTGAIPIGSTITNTASLWDVIQIDTNNVNNSASAAIVTTYIGDITTSTKSVLDLNGGDVEAGDILRYTINIINSDSIAVAGATVTDEIPANFNSFGNISIPAGATNASLFAPSGANGNGKLIVTNITIAGNSSVTIVFNVTINSGTPAGTKINNSAVITNPYGLGATPAAPQITVQGTFVPIAGMKNLYLYDDLSTPIRKLSRTKTTTTSSRKDFAPATFPGAFSWTLDPVAVKDITIDPAVNPTVPVYLYLRSSSNPTTVNVKVDLQCSSGGTTLTETKTGISLNSSNRQKIQFNLTTSPAPWTSPVTCSTGNRWILTVTQLASSRTDDAMRLYMTNLSGTDNSRVELPASTVINIDSIDYYDAISGGNLLTQIPAGQTVYIRTTVSDPFGSFDINANNPATLPNITLTDPTGVTVVTAAMTELVTLTTASTKTFQYAYAVPATPSGKWTVRVDAVEGTEGTVSDFGLRSLTVVAPPNLLVVKSADRARVNSGEIIIYTITTSNSGPGVATIVKAIDNLSPYVSLILDYDGVTPPYQPFDFVPSSSGLTTGIPSYYDSSGLFTPNFTAGEDGNVTRWELPLTGTFSAGGDFTLRFKVRVK